MGNSRQVLVYLPPGYHDHPDKNYPVMYLCDGQNVFEKGTAFGGTEWQADEAAQQLMTRGKMQERHSGGCQQCRRRPDQRVYAGS